jgi:hypothetical protein
MMDKLKEEFKKVQHFFSPEYYRFITQLIIEIEYNRQKITRLESLVTNRSGQEEKAEKAGRGTLSPDQWKPGDVVEVIKNGKTLEGIFSYIRGFSFERQTGDVFGFWQDLKTGRIETKLTCMLLKSDNVRFKFRPSKPRDY